MKFHRAKINGASVYASPDESVLVYKEGGAWTWDTVEGGVNTRFYQLMKHAQQEAETYLILREADFLKEESLWNN